MSRGKRNRTGKNNTSSDRNAYQTNKSPQTSGGVEGDSNQSIDDSNGEITQETYEKYRAVLVDLEKANTDQHDKAVLQLSTATLGVSATFAGTSFSASSFSALIAGWCFLVFSIILMLLSFYFGKRACTEQRTNWDEMYRSGHVSEQNNSIDRLEWLTNLTTFFGSGCFVIGLVFCLISCGINSRNSEFPAKAPPQSSLCK